MSLLSQILIVAIAGLHTYIMVLEMFLWQSPRARRAFGTSAEFAAQTRVLAANQGLYNGFLAAGLIWSLLGGGISAAVFFLCCIAVAGIYGAATASRRILFIQTVPAACALASLML